MFVMVSAVLRLTRARKQIAARVRCSPFKPVAKYPLVIRARLYAVTGDVGLARIFHRRFTTHHRHERCEA